MVTPKTDMLTVDGTSDSSLAQPNVSDGNDRLPALQVTGARGQETLREIDEVRGAVPDEGMPDLKEEPTPVQQSKWYIYAFSSFTFAGRCILNYCRNISRYFSRWYREYTERRTKLKS